MMHSITVAETGCYFWGRRDQPLHSSDENCGLTSSFNRTKSLWLCKTVGAMSAFVAFHALLSVSVTPWALSMVTTCFPRVLGVVLALPWQLAVRGHRHFYMFIAQCRKALCKCCYLFPRSRLLSVLCACHMLVTSVLMWPLISGGFLQGWGEPVRFATSSSRLGIFAMLLMKSPDFHNSLQPCCSSSCSHQELSSVRCFSRNNLFI